MQTVIAERTAPARSPSRADNELVTFASPVLQLVIQIKAGLITPSNELRPTIDALLKQMEERGQRLYKERDLQAAKFALAAFVDETVLTADFPLRDQWEKYPLQLEYFGEHLAGVKFFERLDELLKNPNVELDLVEVYYLCLILGFKGKYKIYMEDQLQGVIQNVAEYLRRAGRLRAGALSPHWKIADQPAPAVDPGLPMWAKLGGGLAIGLVILIYMILIFWIRTDLNSAREQLLR